MSLWTAHYTILAESLFLLSMVKDPRLVVLWVDY